MGAQKDSNYQLRGGKEVEEGWKKGGRRVEECKKSISNGKLAYCFGGIPLR